MRRTALIALTVVLVVWASTLVAQTTRGTFTGIVTDSTGAVIPGVTVTARNTATGVEYNAETTISGVYTIGALPIGQYSITFTSPGFQAHERTGLNFAAGQTIRLDVILEVGEVVERVTVSAAASMLDTETSQTTESVSSGLFANLPLSFGSGRNMAQFADKLVPGVDGSAWNMRIQGMPGGTAGVLVDGMTNLAGFLPGDFGEASISPEAVEELTVMTGNVSAEHGRQSGGTLNFTLKSGTNDLHGTAFYYQRNEALNANSWTNNFAGRPRDRDRRRDWGFSAGGPVYLPKVYDGKNRTFFYFTMERFSNSTTGVGDLTKSVPQPEMWGGDLSRLVAEGAGKVGVDALGNPVLEGQIFDPTTLRQVNGQWVADAFPMNLIPSSRISQVARNFASVFDEWYPPVNDNIRQNLYYTRQYAQNVEHYTLKVDHSISTNHKVSGYWYKHSLPRNFQENRSEIWSLKDPDLGGPLSRAIRQHRRGYNWNVNYDWIVGPTKFNHFSFGINWNDNGFMSRILGQQYADQWGIKGVGTSVSELSHLAEDQITRPFISLGSSPVVTFESFNHDANRDSHYRGIIINDSFSWQRGNHSLKFGFEYNHLRWLRPEYNNTGGTFNFSSRTTAIPGQPYTSRLGNSFASLLLGEVDSARVTIPFSPFPELSRYYLASFVQDAWKSSPKLTVNFGLRWSGNSGVYEIEDRMAQFSPTLSDPNFGGIPGAVEYLGYGPGRAGRDTYNGGHWGDFGPSFGFAYQLTGKWVVRGGYGISYTPEAYGWSSPYAAGFQQTNDVPADSRGVFRPVFNIDGGYPGTTTDINLDPSWATTRSGTIYHPGHNQSGYVQSFNFGFQYEPQPDLLVEVEWRGSKGTRLHADDHFRPNQIRVEELARGATLTKQISSEEQASAAGLRYPYPGFSGLGAWTLLPFPQMQNRGLSQFGTTDGFSTYHSGNLIITKRMSRGIYAYGAYTFSKTIANVTDSANGGDGAGGTQDSYNRTLYKSISPRDRTHIVKSAVNWDVPFGRGRRFGANINRVADTLLGGWQVSALLNYSSGFPLSRVSSRVSPNFWNGPSGTWANFNTPAGGFRSVWDPSKFNPNNRNDPGNRFFDPSAFTDANPQSLGNSPVRFPQVRLPWTLSEDLSILKHFPIWEQFRLQFRAEFLNVFNRHYFANPDMSLNSPSFGSIWQVSSAAGRSIQLGARLEW